MLRASAQHAKSMSECGCSVSTQYAYTHRGYVEDWRRRGRTLGHLLMMIMPFICSCRNNNYTEKEGAVVGREGQVPVVPGRGGSGRWGWEGTGGDGDAEEGECREEGQDDAAEKEMPA